jgi:hypothetical protein
MAASNNTAPKYITDKNGKITTVHALTEPKNSKSNSRVQALGRRSTTTRDDGTERKSLFLSSTETAKLIRETLKEQFSAEYPDTKFSVRSSSYSGGASINVSYTDGPSDKEVKEVVGGYAGSTFNGMIDLKEYKSSKAEDGTEVHYGSDYVFVRREISDNKREDYMKELAGMLGVSEVDPNRLYETPSEIYMMRDKYRDQIGNRSIRYETYASELVEVIAIARGKEERQAARHE